MSWVAFNEQDARALNANGIESSIANGNLASALSAAAQSVLLIPSRHGSHVLIAECRKPAPAPVKAEALRSAGFESSGILGLDGDAVYLDELPQPKPWWKRIL